MATAPTFTTNQFRYRYGETDPVQIPYHTGAITNGVAAAGVAVRIGDLCYVDTADANGSTVAGLGTNLFTVKPADAVTWVAALAAPAAPTAADSGVANGSTFTTATWNVVATYRVYKEGVLVAETAASTPAAVAMTAAHFMKVAAITMPALPAGADTLTIAYYVEATAGGGTYFYVSENDGSAFEITGIGGGAPAVQPPAASTATATALTQLSFMATFAGVAGQAFDGSNTLAYGIKDGYLRIDTKGVFEFACAASSSFNVGDKVGVAKQSGNFLDPQVVVAVSNRQLAIGRVAGKGVTSSSTVLVAVTGRYLKLSN